ncbi:MAG: indolepyruvate oxidoreductase subunit beta [Desulfurococcus sp.]|nr:indolepyruvate oxidoreductase subunit beta [Desulfurococcus sp.]
MKTKFNVLLTGVGGQGLITLGRLIGLAVMRRGLNVTIAEVHGLSQRGGSVTVHVRIGEGDSPVIPSGGAHVIIAMEMLEGARSLTYANRNTTIVLNDVLLPPPLSKYPTRESIAAELLRKGVRYFLYNADKASIEVVGSSISSNVALLGYALAVDRELSQYIGLDDVEYAIEKTFKGRLVEVNKILLRKSYEDGLRDAGG